MTSGPFPAPVWAPPPPPARHSRYRGLLIALGVGCTVIAVVLGTTSWLAYRGGQGAGATARHYFQALADGHAASALGFADVPPNGSSASYLTDKVLAQQLKLASISDVQVGATRESGAHASVAVSYLLRFADGSRRQQDTVTLARHGSTWRLDAVAVTTRLTSSLAARDRLTFAGRPLPSAAVAVFPGALPLATDTAALTLTQDTAVRLADDGTSTNLALAVSAPARTQVVAGLTSALRSCLVSTSTDPFCPIVYGGRPVPGSMHGSLISPIDVNTTTITLSAQGKGILDVTAVADVKVQWSVWDFNNQVVSRQQATKLPLSAVASVENPQATSWAP